MKMDNDEDRNGINLRKPKYYTDKMRLEDGTVTDESNEPILTDSIREILRMEAPISYNLLIRRLAKAFDIPDHTIIQELADKILRKEGIERVKNLKGESTVLLSKAMNVDYKFVRRYPEKKRDEDISELPETELRNALTY